jgi:cytochrome c biogenesis protein CcmG/thiol:disulfide interchange protein DsbE
MQIWARKETLARRRLCALVLGLAFATPVMALDKGAPAPLFELAGHEAQAPVKLAAYLGKFVYVDFWASWCAPCRQSFPWMNALQAKYGAQGLQIIGVNLDAKKEDAADFLQTTPAHFMLAFDPDGATPRSYGVKSMPTGFLIGPDGKIIFEHRGFNQADSADFEGKIKAVLGAQK